MNTELLLRVADAIEAEPARFNMATWYEDSDTTLCGSVGCIAGTACALTETNTRNWVGVESRAARYLDLDVNQADRLFTNDGGWWAYAAGALGHETPTTSVDGELLIEPSWCLASISAKVAADVLRALAEGRVTL